MKICFICHANICRSFISQELLKKLLADNGRLDVEVISRGTYALPYIEVPQKIKNFLSKNGIIFNGHTPTQYGKEDLNTSDLIFVMTKKQLYDITDKYSQFSDKIFLLSEYVLNEDTEIKDPINLEGSSFERAALKIKDLISILYKKI
jgi:protein-tyrosine-phosphatase